MTLIEDGFTIRNSGRRDLWDAAGPSALPPAPGAGLQAIASEEPESAPAAPAAPAGAPQPAAPAS
jgi:hypothetical protein